MPREELGLHVLAYLRLQQQTINRRNIVSPTSTEVIEYAGPRALEVSRALTEAWMWLEREGLIARLASAGASARALGATDTVVVVSPWRGYI